MKINEVTGAIVESAIAVHSLLGPGLLEQVYKECLISELDGRGLNVDKEVFLPVIYHDRLIDNGYRIDLLVESEVIVELKAVLSLTKLHCAQLLTYLKLSRKKVGLLINFNTTHLKNGIQRVVYHYDGPKPSEASTSVE